MPDPAHHAGFTREGEELGYCMRGMYTRCELVARDGTRRALSSAEGGDSPRADPAKDREIERWMKSAGLPALAPGDCALHARPLDGTWAYPDIVLDVVTVAATLKKDGKGGDELVAQPVVRLGGAVSGEAPVHPITFRPPRLALSPPAKGEVPYNWTELNALALSPDGAELGVVVHSYCMEWCDDFEVVRMPAARFASLVYNDTGFRAYQKGDLDRAADLFLKAAFVDPSRELPAYNLACAWARKGDPRAELALGLAVARGGDAVRARAAKDADFDSVRAAAWFVSLVSRVR